MQETARGVKGIIIIDDSFLVLEKPTGDPDLPGGRKEGNETLIDCLNREIIEEVGIEVNILHPVAYWSFFKKPNLRVNGITYLCNYLGGTVKLSREHKEYFWARVEDIHKLIFVPSYGINMIDLKSISGMLK